MKYVLFLLCIISVSCHERQEESKLEYALKLAGNNRPELEKVLHHYSQKKEDSLKLKAARFLIENMPGHYSLEGSMIDRYRRYIYSDTISSYHAKKALEITLSQTKNILLASRKKEDVQFIQADYLIHHIDRCFQNLYTYSWLENLPFEIFLEYLLPYRFANEQLDTWIDSLHINPQSLLSLKFQDDAKYSFNAVEKISLKERYMPVSLNTLIKIHQPALYSDCKYITLNINIEQRAKQFPSAIDYIPHYPNRNGYHYWNVLVSPEFNNTTLTNVVERRAAKVFRKTFSRHSIPSPAPNEYIPPLFMNPFHKDVTSLYLKTADITIKAKHILNRPVKHLYLSVFSQQSWCPIAISPIENGIYKFNQLGKNIVYLPEYYLGTTKLAYDYPFILNSQGKTIQLIPDTCQKQDIQLIRKYPFPSLLYLYNEQLSTTCLEGCNQKNFQHPDTLLKELTSAITYSFGQPDTRKQYRYLRFSAPMGQIAEIILLDSLGQRLQCSVPQEAQAAFDNDLFTNCNNLKAIIDLGTPRHISKMICIPRNDGNGIYPGNKYELFYYDKNGWQSLGTQIASDYQLNYKNVPSGALYWLRNLTTGIEERIFTIKNGIIRFW